MFNVLFISVVLYNTLGKPNEFISNYNEQLKVVSGHWLLKIYISDIQDSICINLFHLQVLYSFIEKNMKLLDEIYCKFGEKLRAFRISKS